MQKRKTRIIAFILVFLTVFFASSVSASAYVSSKRELKYFKPVSDKNVASYPTVSLFLGESPIFESAYLINETTYVPLRAVSTLAGAAVSYQHSTRSATVTMAGLHMTASDSSYIIMANGRAIFSASPVVIMSDGKMYAPIRSIAKALSLGVEWHEGRRVYLSGALRPLATAEHYYKEDELYWLSRIISAESQGEPLLGQIAVGNVVLNRVRHKDYPNTVWGVIFDKKYGTQFSPVSNGSIYRQPTYSAILAAKICLEGVSVSPDILFFLEPTKSTSSWIIKNRPYAFTVANHYFFN